jgi:histidinol-phosphatase (PHP family)
MFIDYHTHHARCGHASGNLEEYVQCGIQIGLKEIGLSDHMPLLHVDPASYYPEMAMPMEELPRYVEECLQLKEKYKDQIAIKVGLEADYIEHYEEQIARITEAYPWDYVIGSVHFLGDWDVTDYRQTHRWEGQDIQDVYERYYDAVQKAARTGMYDFIGHVDVIKRFGFAPEEPLYELEKQTLDVIKEADIAIEMNASGLRMPCKEMFPSRRMLKYALEIGIPVTVGSDAHQPEKLGQYLPEAKKCLKELGFENLAIFTDRKREVVSF